MINEAVKMQKQEKQDYMKCLNLVGIQQKAKTNEVNY